MRFLLGLALTLIAGAAMAQAPSLPPDVIAAARRPVVMTLPGMDQAVVTSDIRYSDVTEARVAMDIYRPAGLRPADRRGAVVFIHGGGPPGAPMKEMGVYTSYGRLMAAQGLVGVTFTHRQGYPERTAEGGADVAQAIAYVRAHAAEFNIDPDRLCLAAYSLGGAMLTPYVKDAPAYVRCLVAYYPMMDLEASARHRAGEKPAVLAAWSPIRQVGAKGRKPPMFLARAGADEIPDLLPGLDHFIAEAVKADYPLTLANNPGAPHSFDIIPDPTRRTLEILTETFGFMQRHLAG